MFRHLVLALLTFTVILRSQSTHQFGESDLPPTDTMRTYRLPEIVVTASRMARPYEEIPRSVTVLHKNEMRSFVPLSTGELLNRTGGAYVVGAGQNPGMIQSLFLRGAGNNQTAFFIDDVRITDPSSVNGALDLSELSLAGVEQIEIVRGSHSTLYGSSAVGGVVNLLTDRPRTNGVGVGAGVSAGVFGPRTLALNEELSLSYLNATGFFGSAEINNASFNGMDATLDTVTNPLVFKRRDRDGFRKTDLFAKVGYADPRFNIHLSARSGMQKADIDDGAYTDDDNSRLAFRRVLYTYGTSYKLFDDLEVKYIGGRSSMNRDAVDDSSLVDASGRTDGLFTENHWSGSTTSNEVQVIMDGGGVRGLMSAGEYQESMSSRSYLYLASTYGIYESRADLPSQKATTRSLFTHIELEGRMLHPSLSRVTLAGGVRLSGHSTFGRYTTFELNPGYRISDRGLLFGSITTGFNAPSLYQLFAQESHYLSRITRGNRLLKPERSLSSELGLRQELFDGFTFTAVVFQTIVRDAIEYVYLWDKAIGLDTLGNDWMRDDFRGDTYLNLGRQTTGGLELSALFRGKQLEVEGHLALLQGRVEYSPDQISAPQTQGHHVQLFNSGEFLRKNVSSTELVRRPRAVVNLRFTYQATEGFRTHLLIRHAGSRPDIFYDVKRGPYGALATRSVRPYTIVDLNQEISLASGISLFARIENVFNTKYQEINGFSTRGRGIFVGLHSTIRDALSFIN